MIISFLEILLKSPSQCRVHRTLSSAQCPNQHCMSPAPQGNWCHPYRSMKPTALGNCCHLHCSMRTAPLGIWCHSLQFWELHFYSHPSSEFCLLGRVNPKVMLVCKTCLSQSVSVNSMWSVQSLYWLLLALLLAGNIKAGFVLHTFEDSKHNTGVFQPRPYFYLIRVMRYISICVICYILVQLNSKLTGLSFTDQSQSPQHP